MARFERALKYASDLEALLRLQGEVYEDEDGNEFEFRMGMSLGGLSSQVDLTDDLVMRRFVPGEVSLTPIPSNPGTRRVEVRNSLAENAALMRFHRRNRAAPDWSLRARALDIDLALERGRA